MSRIFLLSPAHSGGKRAAMLTRLEANFELAQQVKVDAATLCNVFTFCSGLYFRGKLTYARHFAQPPANAPGFLIITSSRGLVLPDTTVGPRDLSEFAGVPINSAEPRFTRPLQATALGLHLPLSCEVILLGSVATGKYLDSLLPIFGERLRFPVEFSGRGDMSRGALLLRSVAEGRELDYGPVPPTPAIKRRSVR